MKKKILFSVMFLAFLGAKELLACAVCFGDPNSPMVHGAMAGVWFLLGVVGFVLSSILGMTFYWIRRARLVQLQEILRGEESSNS
jgi:hypothetical protein